MIKHKGNEETINLLSKRCYTDHRPKDWNESYISNAIWAASKDDNGVYYFECPEEYEDWLQKQPEYSNLELVEVETIKLEIE
jgi:hypothetical protein